MPANAVVRHIVTFGRVLREVGVEVGPGRVADALKGLDSVELARQDDVYWTLRQTLVSRREDLESFDIAFASWFLARGGRAAEAGACRSRRTASAARAASPGRGRSSTAAWPRVGGWSADELLRTKDFGAMTPEELERAKKLIKAIAVARPRRRTRRLRPDSKGQRRSTCAVSCARRSRRAATRCSARSGAARDAPRKLVLILDVSGSMDAYARALLLYMHAARGAGRRVEAFAFGTRLTRLTPELGSRDPETAFAAAAARVIDWSGGTRIGESLKAYNDEWGRRALSQAPSS